MSTGSTSTKNKAECYKVIAEESNDLAIIISEDFSIQFINKSAADQLNISIHNSINKSIFELFSISGYKTPIQSNYFSQTKPVLTHTNRIVWRVFQTITDNKSKIAILIGHKAAYERDHVIAKSLGQIMDCTPGSLYWKDKEGRYLGCNTFMVKTAGLLSSEDIIGKTDFELWPDHANEIRKNDVKVMSSGKAISLEEKVQIQSGEYMHFASSKVPLKDEHGSIIGIICNSLDITKLKETEAALKAANEKSELSNKAKSSFIENMEHDIRTPFNGVWGFANILAERENDPEKKEFLESIATCAKELLDYCDSVLDFSRIEHGITPVFEKSFNVRELVNSVMKIESIAAKHKNLSFSINQSSKLPNIVIGDPYRLKRILLNLVSNAIKFTNKGGIKISVTKEGKKPQTRLCILKFVIEDTGIGIPESKQSVIYEKFTRGTPSNQGIYKGQGLGLRIVKQFISELEGDIHLDSETNKGTVFTFLLPFKLPLTDEIIDEN